MVDNCLELKFNRLSRNFKTQIDKKTSSQATSFRHLRRNYSPLMIENNIASSQKCFINEDYIQTHIND